MTSFGCHIRSGDIFFDLDRRLTMTAAGVGSSLGRALRRIRHSNFIERTFGETRRRVKVIGRLPGENSCLSLVWAVLDRASRGWRGPTMTPKALRLLADLRRQPLEPAAPDKCWRLGRRTRAILPGLARSRCPRRKDRASGPRHRLHRTRRHLIEER